MQNKHPTGTAEWWAEIMSRPIEIGKPSKRLIPHSLWVSKSSARRGEVISSNENKVLFSFAQTRQMKEYEMEDFLRLFKEV